MTTDCGSLNFVLIDLKIWLRNWTLRPEYKSRWKQTIKGEWKLPDLCGRCVVLPDASFQMRSAVHTPGSPLGLFCCIYSPLFSSALCPTDILKLEFNFTIAIECKLHKKYQLAGTCFCIFCTFELNKIRTFNNNIRKCGTTKLVTCFGKLNHSERQTFDEREMIIISVISGNGCHWKGQNKSML